MRIGPKWLTNSCARRHPTDLSTVLTAAARAPDLGATDAGVVTDPIDAPRSPERGPTIAELNRPARRLGLLAVGESLLHRLLLLLDALFLPLTDEADIEEHRIANRRKFCINGRRHGAENGPQSNKRQLQASSPRPPARHRTVNARRLNFSQTAELARHDCGDVL